MTVRAKILLQKIWKCKVTRDEPLSDTITDRWTVILTNLRELPNLFITRLYFKGGTHIDICLCLPLLVPRLMEP